MDVEVAAAPLRGTVIRSREGIVDELPVEPHEVPMRLVVTEQRTITAGARDQGSGRG